MIHYLIQHLGCIWIWYKFSW